MGVSLNGGFPQQPWVFPTKMIILVVFWGYHHLRKHPYVKDITVLFAEFSEFQFCNVISYQRTEQRLLQAHAFISRLLHDDAWSGNHRAVVSASCSEVITAVQNRGCNPPFLSCTLQGTNISTKNGILKMIFLFPRWDMLIPWRVLVGAHWFLRKGTMSGCHV